MFDVIAIRNWKRPSASCGTLDLTVFIRNRKMDIRNVKIFPFLMTMI